MKIEVNITKKYAFLIIGIFLILGIIFAVYAYNSNPANPAILGHSASEVEVNINGNPTTLQNAVTSGQLGGLSITGGPLYVTNPACSNPNSLTTSSTCSYSTFNCGTPPANCTVQCNQRGGADIYTCNNAPSSLKCMKDYYLASNGDGTYYCHSPAYWHCSWFSGSCTPQTTCMFTSNTNNNPSGTSNPGDEAPVRNCGFTGGYAYCCGIY